MNNDIKQTKNQQHTKYYQLYCEHFGVFTRTTG